MHRIDQVTTEAQITECVRVMRTAFGTVAGDFGLTPANAPTNPAFMTADRIRESGGRVASLGLMNDNAVLKDWYISHGFVETERRRFDHLPFEVCFMSRPLGETH